MTEIKNFPLTIKNSIKSTYFITRHNTGIYIYNDYSNVLEGFLPYNESSNYYMLGFIKTNNANLQADGLLIQLTQTETIVSYNDETRMISLIGAQFLETFSYKLLSYESMELKLSHSISSSYNLSQVLMTYVAKIHNRSKLCHAEEEEAERMILQNLVNRIDEVTLKAEESLKTDHRNALVALSTSIMKHYEGLATRDDVEELTNLLTIKLSSYN
jgi:hypothetical protein